MRARPQRSGRIYYYYDPGGKPRKEIPLGSDYVEAVKKWGQLEGDQGAPHVKLITFRYVAELYLIEELPKKALRTRKDNLAELENLYQFFDNPPAPLAEIKPLHIKQYLNWRVSATEQRLRLTNEDRAKIGKPPLSTQGRTGEVRANREKALFSHIWNYARGKGFTDQMNPCQGIRGYSEKGRDHYVDDAVLAAIWHEADEPLRDALDLAYLCGQRPADTLKMAETDIHDGQLSVRQNKTHNRLRIVVEGELRAVIDRVLARKKLHAVRTLALVCNEKGQPLSSGALDSRFEKARKLAADANPALAGLILATQFRDLRAKAGTDKEEQAGMQAAQDQLGHASSTMTRHYVRHRKGKLVSPTK
ncbi:tyrosine-type recombinase/integrase [Thiomonas sp.]